MVTKTQTKIIVYPEQAFTAAPRADQGFVRFVSVTSFQDFSSIVDDPPAIWDASRQAVASSQILASLQYSEANAYGVSRLAPTNAKGFYTKNFSFHQALNYNPDHGLTWTGLPNDQAVYLNGTETYPESWFVHEDGTADWTGRIQNRLIATRPRYLMKFDRQDFFDSVIVPEIAKHFQTWISLKLPGPPGIVVDLCPGSRGLWQNAAGELVPTIQWDHFLSEEELYDAWVLTFRRLRAKFPNLQIMVNWGVDPSEDLGDRVLEVIDGIMFETASTFNPPLLKRSLATARKAALMGKTVVFEAQYFHDTVPPTVDDFGRTYFSAFLMTLGPHTLWGGQWAKPSVAYSGAVADVEPFTRWIGPPAGDMREVMPGLWHRRFYNLDVYINTSEFAHYTLKLQGAVDDDGDPVESVTLTPGQGNYFFRQSEIAAGYANSGYWNQLPEERGGERVRIPGAIVADSILGTIGVGAGEGGGNLLKDTNYASGWADVGGSMTLSTATERYRGLKLIQAVNNSAPGQFQYTHDLTGLDGKYLHLFFYVKRVSGEVDSLMVLLEGVGSPIYMASLTYGAPKLHHCVVVVPNGAGVSNITFQTRPDDKLGTIMFGGVKLFVSDTADTDDAWAEFVETAGGIGLTRGYGVGIGLPAYLSKVSGYARSDGGAPTIDLLNDTDVGGLPVKKIYEDHTTTDLNNLGNGVWTDVVTTAIADWKKARQLVVQFAASFQMGSADAANFAHWRLLLDGAQVGSTVSIAAPSSGVNYSAAGQAVAELATGAHTLKLQVIANSGGVNLDIEVFESASLMATIAEVS